MSTEDVSVLLGKLAAEGSRQQVPIDLLHAAFIGENSGSGKMPSGKLRTDAVSPKQARGVMQVLPSTFEGLKKNGVLPATANIDDIDTNIAAGVAVLAEALKTYGGNKQAALAHYNGGNAAGRAVAAGKEPPAAETQNYLRKTGMATSPAPAAGAPASKASTTEGVSVRINNLDPVAAQSDFAKYAEQNAQFLSMMQDAIHGRAGMQGQVAVASIDRGKAAGDSALAEGDILAAQNQQRVDIVDALNIGINDPGSTLIGKWTEVEKARVQQVSMRQEIAAEEQVSIFEDPLRWLTNQFTLPTKKQAYNEVAIREQQLIGQIKDDQALAAAQQNIDGPSLVKSFKDRANAEAAKFAANAAVEAAQAMSLTAVDTINLAQAHLHVVGAEYTQKAAMATRLAEQFRFSAMESAQNKQQKDFAPTLDIINVRRAQYGLSPYSFAEFGMLDKKKQADLMEDAKRPTTGRSIEDSLKWMWEYGAVANLATTNPAQHRFLAALLNSEEVKAEERRMLAEGGAKFAGMDPNEVKIKAMATVAKNQYAALSKARNYDQLPQGHFARLDWDDAAVQESTRKSPIAALVMEAKASKQMGQPVEMKEVAAKLIAKAVADQKSIPTLARDLSEFVRASQIDKWKRTGAELGFPRPEEYVFDQFEGTHKVNAWSPAQVEQWLIQNVAHTIALPGFGGVLGRNMIARNGLENKE